MLPKQVVRAFSLVLIMVLAALSPLLNPAIESGWLKDNPITMHTNPALDAAFDWWEVDYPTNNAHTSTAVDSNDEVHIAYSNGSNGYLYYATYDGSSWSNSTVDSTGYVGSDCSIAIDSNDNLHISYYDQTNNDLKYATYDGSSWTFSIVDSVWAKYTSIAIDSNDDLHISYYDESNHDLKYATYDGSSWTNSTIDSTGDVGVTSSIAVDSNDNIHISYYRDDANEDLKYATYDGSSWTVSTVDSTGTVGAFTSIAVDSNDDLHISYHGSTESLRYATYDGSSWTTSILDSSSPGGQDFSMTSIEIDSNDDVSILYQANYELNIVTQTDGSWSSPQSIDVPTGGNVGIAISSDLDSNDKLRISYQGDSASKSGYGLYHIQMLSDLRIDSLSPNSAEVGNETNVTITGAGFDQLSQYKRDIDISNDFDYGVENYSIIVENPTLDETGLIASYHFEDDDLVTVADTGGYGLDGTVMGSPTHDDGVFGSSLDLDGTNDYVVIEDDDLLDLGSEDFTIMLWVRRDGASPASTPAYEGMMGKAGGGGGGYTIGIPNNQGGGVNQTYSILTTDGYTQSSLGRDTGVWHHLAFTYDYSSSFMQIYTDGSADGSATLAYPISSNDADLVLGAFYSSGFSPLNGVLDDVKIYSRALDSTEIADYYNIDYRADYGDVRFWDDDGSSLEYEMLADGQFMVNIPSMYAFENRTISMSYGAKGLESESQDLDDWFDDYDSGDQTWSDSDDSEKGFTFWDDAVGYWPLDDEPTGAWVSSIADDISGANVGQYTSIAVDSNDNLHISYYDYSTEDLKYATYDGSSWTNSTIWIGAVGVHAGLYSSIAVDSNDEIHISFSTNHGLLKYATYDGSSWTISTVDSTGYVGGHTSIAVDSNDNLHISYSWSNGDILKYATYDGSFWTISTADNSGHVGGYTSIAVDSNDNLHISYYDAYNKDLKYATYDGSSWSTSTIDSTNNVGEYTSIAVDSYDNLHISYYDATNLDLKYATYDGSSWTASTVDSTNNVGSSTSIAVDSNDNLHISYCDGSYGYLKYATYDDSSWTVSTIDSAGNLAYYTSIAVDSNDDLHISYNDDTYHDLKYATFDTSIHIGDLADYSENGYPASSSGNPLAVNGVGGQGNAVHFDGADDYLEVTSSPDWYSGTEFTWSLWVNMDDTVSDQLFIKHGTASGTAGNGAYLNYYQNKVMFTSPLNSGQGVESPTNHIQQGEWTHIALTVDINDDTLLYINGENVTLSAYNGKLTSISSPTGSMYIGRDVLGNLQEFEGTMDDVFILDRALNESEIMQYYIDTVGPRIHYTMDEESGPLIDQSGNGVDALPLFNIDDGLIAYYGLEETSTNYIDESPYGHDLTSNYGITRSSGMQGFGQTFASGWIDSSSRIYAIEDVGTYSLWVKSTDNNKGLVIIDSGYHADLMGIWLDSSGTIMASIESGSGAGDQIKRYSSSTVNDGQWHHVLATFGGDGASSIHIYIDGSLDDGTAIDASISINSGNSRTLHLGRYAGTPSNFFTGNLDEVGIWNRVLLNWEIEQLYSSGAPLAADDFGGFQFENELVAYYGLEDVQMSSAVDSSVNNHDFYAAYDAGITRISAKRNYGQSFTNAWASTNNPAQIDVGLSATISLWMKSTDSNVALVDIDSGYRADAIAVWIDDSTGKARMSFDDNTGVGGNKRWSATDVNDGQWHHIVAVFDGYSPSSMHIYVDGVLDDGSTYTATAGSFTVDPTAQRVLYLGSHTYSNGGIAPRKYTGDLDEVGIWNRVLEDWEIAQLYGGGTPPAFAEGNNLRYGEEGQIDSAIQFNNNRFGIPSGDDSNFSKGGEAFTVNAWVKLNSDTGAQQWIISQESGQAASQEAFQMRWVPTTSNQGYWACSVNTNTVAGGLFNSATSPVMALPTEWTMVTCMFYSVGNYGVDLLLNGALISYDSTYSGAMVNADAQISIGERSDGSSEVDGWIDDIRLYEHLLLYDDVMKLYYETKPPSIMFDFEEPAVFSMATSTIDSTGNVGDYSSIAVDSNDNLHISYYDAQNNDLKYTTYDGSSWTTSTVDSTGDVGQYTSIAVDSNDDLHISYYDNTNFDLKYATYDGSSWTTSTVDSTGTVGFSTSIAVDSNDNLHISYYDITNYDLKYATYDGSSWTVSTVDSTGTVGHYTSIAIDSNDDLHISYLDSTNNDLKYATFDGSSWTTSTVDSTIYVGGHTSIAIDSNDDLHISYLDNTNSDLKYATYDGSSWTTSTVDSTSYVGKYTSIVVDSSDNLHISYHHYTYFDLKYATYDGSSWTVSTVDSTGSTGYYTSIAVDSNDDLHISYRDQSNDNLKYATSSSGPCEFTELWDSSGNGYDAGLYGDPTCEEIGYYGDAMGFDGNGDYVSFYQDSNSDNWQGSTEASVGYHVNLNSLPTAGETVGFQAWVDAVNGTSAGIALGITADGNVDCFIDDADPVGNNPTILTTNLSIEAGTWYHLLCSWDGQNLNLYINGTLSHTYTHSGVYTLSWDNREAYLGKFYSGGGNFGYTDGRYDNFDYWDYALPESAVEAIYKMEDMTSAGSTTIDHSGIVDVEQAIQYEIHLDLPFLWSEATNIVFVNATTITCTFPASPTAGITDVDLVDENGDVITHLANAFEYIFTDSDGDGWADDVDAFPYDWTQWLDTDGDGYGDNISGNNSDTFPLDMTQWNDSDGDGFGDNLSGNNSDAFPFDWTQWLDTDGDGYGDNFSGNNSDAFPLDMTQWIDMDGDGYGDNISGNNSDAFPSEPTQWNDTDGDGYGDNTSGYEGDDCPAVWGNSTNGRYGCIDSDGDGLADVDDAFPNDPLRGGDADGDGYDDALDDDCALIWGNSTQDRVGCIDSDGDGYSDADLNWTIGDGADSFTFEPSQWNDTDGDGYGDNATGFQADACPSIAGYSNILSFGCPDADSDGLSDSDDACPNTNVSVSGTNDTDGDGCNDGEDAFPDDPLEHADSDDDGIGDNSDPEPFIPLDTDGDGYPDHVGYNDSDDCPAEWGNSTTNLIGCVDSDGDGLADSEDDFPDDPLRSSDNDGDGYDDAIEDDCPSEWGNSTIDRVGCLDDDGDGYSNLNDLFPLDSNDWFDDDGDGVGNNSDDFPNDANETKDSDDDGIGDNSDVFPNDKNETKDSDGDGIGDNADLWPSLDNSADSDGDGTNDVEDDFPDDSSQWQDYDGDGYGDNHEGNDSDAFINNATQWADSDGDSYGDNWGDSGWNSTRLLLWPGIFVADALEADHCPSEWGNSTVDGYYGCPDIDGDGIADQYDSDVVTPDNGTGGNNGNGSDGGISEADSDGDGVIDFYDVCPETNPGATVDMDGCKIDADKDGVEDIYDKCPKTPRGSTVNVEGCIIIIEEPGVIDQLLAGEQQAIIKTVGWSALLIAVFGFLQTNMIAALLPDALKWLQFAKRKSKLSKEEEQELTHLQSIVQAYHSDDELLVEELQNLKSDITARYTNSEIKKETREKINTLIEDLIGMEPGELLRIADDERYFGLAGTMDTDERSDMLAQDMAMRDYDRSERKRKASGKGDDTEFKSKNTPPEEVEGKINEEDGHEYIEWPDSSGRWFIRNKRTKLWDEWKD